MKYWILILFLFPAVFAQACVPNTFTILSSSYPSVSNSTLNYTAVCVQDIQPVNSEFLLNVTNTNYTNSTLNLSVSCSQTLGLANGNYSLNSTINSYNNESLNLSVNCFQDNLTGIFPLNKNLTLNTENPYFNNETLNLSLTCVQDNMTGLSLNYTIISDNESAIANLTFQLINNNGCPVLYKVEEGKSINLTGPCDNSTNLTALNETIFSIISSSGTGELNVVPTYYNYSVLCSALNLTEQVNITVDKCVLNLNLSSQYEIDNFYQNYDGNCFVNITIPKFEYPDNTVPVDRARLLEMINTTNLCVGLLNQTGYQNITLLASQFGGLLADANTENQKLNNLIKSQNLCTLDDVTLLRAMKKLPDFEKRYVEIFSKIPQENITQQSFAILIQSDFKDFSYANYYSGIILEDYSKAGLAEQKCTEQYNYLTDSNQTICFYSNNLIPTCINRSATLLEIDREANSEGFWFALELLGIVFMICVFIVWYDINRPKIVPRF